MNTELISQPSSPKNNEQLHQVIGIKPNRFSVKENQP